MTIKCDVLGETGLQFYGKMCTSMSHEIKNALAIIQEHAGLLDDFAVMANEGTPIDPQRVKTLAGKIQGRINRANEIVRGLNRLAHSVHEPVKTVDLGEVLTSLVVLSHRFASVRGVTVEAKPPERTVTVDTSPFFLQNLLWLCLDFAMEAAGGEKSVGLRAQRTDQGAKLKFTQLRGLGDTPLPIFPGESVKALLQVLRAELAMQVETEEIVLTFPGDMRQ